MTAAEHLHVEESATSQDTWRTAWDTALRAVELDVDEAERLIVRMHSGEEIEESLLGEWFEPALSGPMPAEFADRARALLRRQSDVGERLAQALVTARSQTRGLSKFAAPERRPVFVDTAL